MTTYRIDILTGWSVNDSLVSREYRQCATEDEAKQYAASRIAGTDQGYSVNAVAESEEATTGTGSATTQQEGK